MRVVSVMQSACLWKKVLFSSNFKMCLFVFLAINLIQVKSPFIPFKWCHIYKENAFAGWATKLNMKNKSSLPMKKSFFFAINSSFELLGNPVLTIRCLIGAWLAPFSSESRLWPFDPSAVSKVWSRHRECYADCFIDSFGGSCCGAGSPSLGKTRLVIAGGNLNAERQRWDSATVAVLYLHSLWANSILQDDNWQKRFGNGQNPHIQPTN